MAFENKISPNNTSHALKGTKSFSDATTSMYVVDGRNSKEDTAHNPLPLFFNFQNRLFNRKIYTKIITIKQSKFKINEQNLNMK